MRGIVKGNYSYHLSMTSRIHALLFIVSALLFTPGLVGAQTVEGTVPEVPFYLELIDAQESVIDESTGMAVYEIKFEVTASDTDVYIPTVTPVRAGSKGAEGITYEIYGKPRFSGTTTAVLTGTASTADGYFLIKEGDSETLSLTVSAASEASGKYGMRIKALRYKTEHTSGVKIKKLTKDELDQFATRQQALMVPGDVVGAIDRGSLKTTVANPTITGVAQNTSNIGFSLSSVTSGDKVYGSDAIAVKNGAWSHTISSNLMAGKYRITLTAPDGEVLDTKTLVVNITPEIELVNKENIEAKLGQLITLGWKVHNAPTPEVLTEVAIKLKKKARGYNGPNATKSFNVVSIPTGPGKFIQPWDTNGFAPGTYEVRMRIRACDPANCTRDAVGKPLGKWTSSLMVTLTPSSVPLTEYGTLDAASLKTNSKNPTIIGTAKNAAVVGLVINRNGGKEYDSGSIKVKNGKWSHTVSTNLQPGTYDLTLYGSKNNELADSKLHVTTSCPVDKNAAKLATIVGVYEGKASGVRTLGTHPEGTVTVNVTSTDCESPQSLILTSYEPVHWIINNPNGARFTKVITVGYYAQRVTGLPKGVPVEHNSFVKNRVYQNAYEPKGAGMNNLIKWMKKKKLQYSGEFYGGYTGDMFNISWGYKG